MKLADVVHRLRAVYSRPDLPAEERSRRSFLALCLGVLVPFVAAFGIVDLRQGRQGEAAMTFVMVALMAATLVLLPRWQAIWHLFRLATLAGLALVLYLTAVGGSEGFAFLWLYGLPLMAFFLFGMREGVAWIVASYAGVLALFVGGLGTHSYGSDVGVRFLITYALVSLLAFGLEAHRSRNQVLLRAEKAALEDHLAQVRVLRGLLPICASCKSVRDDRGYWNTIETYLERHSNAELSHSSCPDCSAAIEAMQATESWRGPDATAPS